MGEGGVRTQVVNYGGILALVPVADDPIEMGAGLLKGDDSLANAIVEEHQRERERES